MIYLTNDSTLNWYQGFYDTMTKLDKYLHFLRFDQQLVWEKFFVCNNVYFKNKNHAINAPCYTLSKPQYTLKKSHHRIPSSIQFQETAVWLCDTTQYFSRVCLELVPGFNAFRLCGVEYVLCDLIRKMCGCGIHNQFYSLPLLPLF